MKAHTCGEPDPARSDPGQSDPAQSDPARSGLGQPDPSRSGRFDERGEGVISAAIAVLVMAFLGVAMWVAFDATFSHAANHVDRQVNCIGSDATSC